MKRSERAAQARRELDRKFAAAQLQSLRTRPRSGWIRAIRSGLGMSQAALARRLRIAAPNVAKLEKSELNGTISVGKLAEIAEALDSTLVYAIVPNSTLEATVQRQARRVAEQALGYVATTMALEDQGLDADRLADELRAETNRVIDRNRMWTDG